jgi:ABC-type polysaccharide/polyol phosphate transport system ATPase subunit
MIRVSDVHKRYTTLFGSNHVLKGVSFTIGKGEKLGILGRNGAGKSTLVRLVSGAEMPTSGIIERGMSVSWPLAFGGAFQPMLSGRDNVRFISRVYNQDFKRNLAFVEDFAELGPYLKEPVRTYSSGMRARLAFAISMIIEFDCFLIDEIGAVGDARFHERCNYELFDKRSDRAMIIISHDAAYLRDHCNRFAILHDSRLRVVDDFDEAYHFFRQLIGIASTPGLVVHIPRDRARLIETTQTRALADEQFRLQVAEGDLRRDKSDWAAAESAYASALALYPYQRSYWVQHGHAAKELGRYHVAEVSYRTACALGEPLPDLREHLGYVLLRQNLSEDIWPLCDYRPGHASLQTPAAPDARIFARMLWLTDGLDDGELLALLREHASCDALLARMIGDERFGQSHASWIEERHDNRPTDAEASIHDGCTNLNWAALLTVIACPTTDGHNTERIASSIRTMESSWRVLVSEGGFSGWPLTQVALKAWL